MTLLTTMTNLGFRWSNTLSLWLVDKITWKICEVDQSPALLSTALEAMNNKCSNQNSTDICMKNLQGNCLTEIDGFYIEILINTVYGVVWWFWARKMVDQIQSTSQNDWHIVSRNKDYYENRYEDSIVDDKSVSVCYI